MSVFVVTRGDYSDYEILAVFSTREKAQAFVDAFPGKDDCGILTFECDADPEAGFVTTVTMGRDGTVEYVSVIDALPEDEPTLDFAGVIPERDANGCYVVGTLKTTDSGQAAAENLRLGIAEMILDVRTASRERAVKVANEKRTILLAHEAWGDEAKARQILGMAP